MNIKLTSFFIVLALFCKMIVVFPSEKSGRDVFLGPVTFETEQEKKLALVGSGILFILGCLHIQFVPNKKEPIVIVFNKKKHLYLIEKNPINFTIGFIKDDQDAKVIQQNIVVPLDDDGNLPFDVLLNQLNCDDKDNITAFAFSGEILKKDSFIQLYDKKENRYLKNENLTVQAIIKST